jgi:hypothetical protein
MSKSERASWVNLVTNALIGGWYFALVLRAPGDSQLLGPGMAPFIAILVIVAIFTAISSELLLRWIQRRAGSPAARGEQLDERDRLINLHAARNAYLVLLVAIGAVMSLIAMTGWMDSWNVPRAAVDTVLTRMIRGPLTGPVIVQWLLLALTLAELSRHVSRIVSYRRGY